MKRISKGQKPIVEALKRPGVYLSYQGGKNYEVMGAPKVRHGWTLPWLIQERTVECLKEQGLIVHGQREYESRVQVGFFAAAVPE